MSESGGPTGYTAGAWSCTGGSVTDGIVTVPTGGTVTCTLDNDDQPATLTLVKVVDPAASGSGEVPADWTLTAAPSGIVGQGPVSGNGDPTSPGGVSGVSVFAGSYALTESGPDGFDPGDWVCTGGVVGGDGDSVTIPSGGNVTCTITNTAVGPTLTLVKIVENDNGGTAVPTDWTLTAAGPSSISGATGAASVTDAAVEVGSYDLSESGGPGGYSASDWVVHRNRRSDRRLDGQPGRRPAHDLHDHERRRAGHPHPGQDRHQRQRRHRATHRLDPHRRRTHHHQREPSASRPRSRAPPVDAGAYDLSETDGPTGYTPGPWTCTGGTVTDGTVTIPNDGDVTCTITNDDQPGTLTLVKTVTNDNGGTALPTDWTLTADGPTTISGAVGDPAVTDATVDAGAYDLSETDGPTGYTPGPWTCTGGTVTDGTVTIPNDGDVTCTIDNDDEPGTLTLVKTVTNDNGGTALPTDWTLTADGPTTISGSTGSAEVTSATVDAGAYILSEGGGPTGYTGSDWSCTGGTVTDGTVEVADGSDVTCTIDNDDEPARLTLVKTVVNDDGGTAVGRRVDLVGRWLHSDLRGNRHRSRHRSHRRRRRLRPLRNRRPHRLHPRALDLHRRHRHRRHRHHPQRRRRHLHHHQRRPTRHPHAGQGGRRRERRGAERLDPDRRRPHADRRRGELGRRHRPAGGRPATTTCRSPAARPATRHPTGPVPTEH